LISAKFCAKDSGHIFLQNQFADDDDVLARKPGRRNMADYVGAVDQGTTSTRFIVFDRSGRMIGLDQKEHRQIFLRPGWVEHDTDEIWDNTRSVIAGALTRAGIRGSDLAAVGITNQRETTVIWDKHTGKPI